MESLRRLSVSAVYIATAFFLFNYRELTEDIYEAIIEGEKGVAPYLLVVGIIIPVIALHKIINWIFQKT